MDTSIVMAQDIYHYGLVRLGMQVAFRREHRKTVKKSAKTPQANTLPELWPMLGK